MTGVAGDGPAARYLTGLALGSGALLFRYIRWWEALALLIGSLVFTAYGLPRLSVDRRVPITVGPGALAAPPALSVLVLLLIVAVLPGRLDIAAAAAGLLAADGAARLMGARSRGALAAAHLLVGGAAASFLCWWCRPAIVPPPYGWFSTVAPWVAAATAGGAASVRTRPAPSVTLAVVGASMLWAASLVSEDRVVQAASAVESRWLSAIAVNIAGATVGVMVGSVTTSGAACGALVGTLILLSTGWGGWLLLIASFGMVVVTTRLGLRRKQALGIAEPRHGRRSAGSAIANTGVAGVAAVLSAVGYVSGPARVAFVAALAAGAADTVASEIGKARASRTWLPPLMRPTAPGANGGVSVEGTLAGVVAAILLSALAALLGLVTWSSIVTITAAAVVASAVESVLAATLEPDGVLDSHALNVVATAVAAAAAVFWHSSLT